MSYKLRQKLNLRERIQKRSKICFHQGSRFSFVSGAPYSFQNGKIIRNIISQQIAERLGFAKIHNSVTRVV